MDYEKNIEIPFGAKDSELKCWEYTIPEGMEAIIKDGKVIVREKESEDERIRRWMINQLSAVINTESAKEFDPTGYEMAIKALSWLEKQKELPFVKDVMLGYSGLYFYDGERMHFRGNPAMEEKQKEQKPVDNEEAEITDFERSVYDLCPVLSIEEAKATASDLLELAKKTLLKKGKVVLASNYPEGCSFEDGFHLGYNEGFNANKKEQNPTNSEKPKEWSEEDEAMIKRVIERIEAEIQYGDALTMAYGNQEIAWLKSLRPSWRPSEEQMKELELIINGKAAIRTDFIRTLYNDLKKLI